MPQRGFRKPFPGLLIRMDRGTGTRWRDVGKLGLPMTVRMPASPRADRPDAGAIAEREAVDQAIGGGDVVGHPLADSRGEPELEVSIVEAADVELDVVV